MAARRPKSKFTNVCLLHGRGEGPGNTVLPLEKILAKNFPKVNFNSPLLLHSRPEASIQDSLRWMDRFAPFLSPGTLLVGAYTGGFLAAKYQETHPELDMHVIAIAAPTSADGVQLETLMPNRVALCSGCQDWKELTDESYDVSWLTHEVAKSKHRLAYLISCYMLGKDLKKQIDQLFPA